jgi:hypothetical protein
METHLTVALDHGQEKGHVNPRTPPRLQLMCVNMVALAGVRLLDGVSKVTCVAERIGQWML